MNLIRFFKVLNLIIFPLILLITIWYPLVAEYYVQDADINDKLLVQARDYPLEKIVTETNDLEFGALFPEIDGTNLLTTAQKITEGKLYIPELVKSEIKLPFDEKLVHAFHSYWQLSYCGFVIPHILIRAYDISNNVRYLELARDFILGWSEFEKEQWIPQGFIWNDHAIASRATVLSKFWVRYKQHQIFNNEDAIKILQLVNKTAGLLEKDRLYTYKTNHGTMQSLALLKLATYFPLLDGMENFKQKAIERLNYQFQYLINSEGVVLEHSAGYHQFGTELLGATIKLFEVNNVKVSSALFDKYNHAKIFLDRLRRTDGSLPAIGDTNIKQVSNEYIETVFKQEINSSFPSDSYIKETLLPKAGYAIWSVQKKQLPEKQLGHTAILWSYFTYMGHKHADELSINIWSKGQNWLTNVGYWPYTSIYRKKAIGWNGSNAPHLNGEGFSSTRRSKVLSFGGGDNVRFIELLRIEKSGFHVRRQIFQLGIEAWLVIDSFEDHQKDREAKIVWTTDTSLQLNKKSKNIFKLHNPHTGDKKFFYFQLSTNNNVETTFANKEKLIGWNASGQNIFPAHAMVVNMPSHQTWSAMIVQNELKEKRGTNNLIDWQGVENWEVQEFNGVTISRNGSEIQIKGKDEFDFIETYTLKKVPDPKQNDEENFAAFQYIKNIYGSPFRPLIEYRKKVSIVVFILTLGLVVFYYFVRKRFIIGVSALNVTAWVILIIWLNQYYFI